MKNLFFPVDQRDTSENQSMPLDHEIVERIVEEMLEAEAKRTLAPLVSSRYPRFTIDDAYRIQMKLMERKIEAGEKVVGKKV